ncbi:MAG: DNA gyrase subunit A [Nibricoccus sp.]
MSASAATRTPRNSRPGPSKSSSPRSPTTLTAPRSSPVSPNSLREKEIDGIRDIRDESDENTRIVIELKRGEQAKVVINQLYQKTALESSFGVTLLALDKKRPKQMNIKELIECYIEHRRDVITRRTQFRLKRGRGPRPHPRRLHHRPR